MWIDPETNGEFDVAIGACVKSIEGENICLVDDDNQVSHLFLFFTSNFYFTVFLVFWPTVLSVEPMVQCLVCLLSVVCLSSVTFCIVAKRCILAKKCLKE